jgi:hypothetical protein
LIPQDVTLELHERLGLLENLDLPGTAVADFDGKAGRIASVCKATREIGSHLDLLLELWDSAAPTSFVRTRTAS